AGPRRARLAGADPEHAGGAKPGSSVAEALRPGGRDAHRRALHPALSVPRRRARLDAVGRQPAEGGPGQVDGARPARSLAGRADAGPGRPGQARRPRRRARAGRRRQGRHRLQLGGRRDRRPLPPRHRAGPGDRARRAGPRSADRRQHLEVRHRMNAQTTDLPLRPEPGAVVAATGPGRLTQVKKELTMLGVMIALAALTAVLNPIFLDGDNLRNTIRHISLISLFALGEAVVIIAGGIDLSVGSVICVSAVTTSYLTMYVGLGIGPAVALALVLSLAIGAAQGLVITWLGVQPFVVTLGSMLLLRGIAEVLTGGTDIGFQGKFPGFRFLGEGVALGMPTPFWFALVAIAVTAFLMHRSVFGRYCYAIGSNDEAARLSGVPVRWVGLATYIASAGLAGVAGILYVAYLPSATP